MNLPNKFLIQGLRYNLAGSGARPGSFIYAAPQTGAVIEAYPATVINSGPKFALASIAGLGTVKIEANACPAFGALLPGGRVLIAGLAQCATGLCAVHAVALSSGAPRPAPQPKPKPRYDAGTISSLDSPTHGWIKRDDGQRIFLHVTNLEGGFRAGARVTFQSLPDARGIRAINARVIPPRPRY